MTNDPIAPKSVSEATRDHFRSTESDDEWVVQKFIGRVMFWPLLPMTIAKGRHPLIRLAAMLAFPILYVINIPLMVVVIVPGLTLVVAREMWKEMQS